MVKGKWNQFGASKETPGPTYQSFRLVQFGVLLRTTGLRPGSLPDPEPPRAVQPPQRRYGKRRTKQLGYPDQMLSPKTETKESHQSPGSWPETLMVIPMACGCLCDLWTLTWSTTTRKTFPQKTLQKKKAQFTQRHHAAKKEQTAQPTYFCWIYPFLLDSANYGVL